jgi:cell wall-associated NlpC family hydrolase
MEHVAALRCELLRRHGWTHLEIKPTIDARHRTLTLQGTVATHRVKTALLATVTGALAPYGWRLRAQDVRPLAALRRVSLRHQFVQFFSAPPGCGMRCFTVQVPRIFGPLAVLAEINGHLFVQARDRTCGWVAARQVGAHKPSRPRTSDTPEVYDYLAGKLGTPYRLGRTTDAGIDCSALIQRAWHEATGLLLPRHSADQQAFLGAPARDFGEVNDLIFGYEAAQNTWHVGSVVRGRRPTDLHVIHASTSRLRVVRDPLTWFTRQFKTITHATREQVQACAREDLL